MTAKHSGVAKMWLLNLLAAVYFWLLLPDAHGWQVGVSALAAVAVIFFGVWLRAGTFAYFRIAEFRDNATVWRAFRRSVRHMVALAIWAAAGAALVWLLWSLRTYTPQTGVWMRQKLGAGPSPRNVTRDLNCLIMLLVWLVIPVIWLPLATTIAAAGVRFRHLVRSLRVLRRPAYWLWLCAMMLVGAYVPYKLVWWVPDLSDLRKQAWSMGFRFLLAYVILISAWIALLLVVGTRVEREDPDILPIDEAPKESPASGILGLTDS
jgi:hypothetical protein